MDVGGGACAGAARGGAGTGRPYRDVRGRGWNAAPVPVVYGPRGVAVDAAGAIYIAARAGERVIKIDGRGDASTVAGTGQRGFSGDGGPAISARLEGPFDVAVSSAGDIYILTWNRIRKVDAATGVITTVAGTGTHGFSADGGLARSAQLADVRGIAVDQSSNLYLAEYHGHRIRKVEAATGLISTVAGTGRSGFGGIGGAATSALLDSPIDVAVDGSGNLYIVEDTQRSIRKVDAATGNISTVAERETGWVWRIAVGSAGDIYAADWSNSLLHKVDAATGTVSTVAGTGIQAPGGDGGAASSASVRPSDVAVDRFGNLYIADHDNHRVRRVDAATGNISTIAAIDGTYFGFSGDGAAATAAQLYLPSGVAVDSASNVYIADLRNLRVRKVDAETGNIATVAGTGVRGFSGDGGPAVAAQLGLVYDVSVDAAGNVYVADYGNRRVRRIEAGAGTISTIADRGVLDLEGTGAGPLSVAADGFGNVYVAAGRRVRRVEVATGVVSTIAGTGELGFSGDGSAAVLARLSVAGVAVDEVGNVYIADYYNHRIRMVDAATGIIWTIAGTGEQGFRGDGGLAVSARLQFPFGVAVDALRNIYIADSANDRVRKVDSATGRIETIAGGFQGRGGDGGDGGPARDANLNSPHDVAVDGLGNIYIADWVNHRIRRVWVPGAATSGQRHRPVSRRLAGDSLRLPLTSILAGDLHVRHWRASSSNPSLVTVRVYGDELLLAPEPAAEGAVDIELVAMDADGRSVTVYFRVQVEFHWPIRIARGWRNAIGAMLSAGSG